MWQTRIASTTTSTSFLAIRNASHKAHKKPFKPLVLENPTKFNPPSHGAKLRKDPPRYPGPQLSTEQAEAQKKKKYPNMMPTEGTFMHWFVTNRSIHMYITLVHLPASLLEFNKSNWDIGHSFYTG